MCLKEIPFKTFNVTDIELQLFKESSEHIYPFLPTKIASKKLAAQDLRSCMQYQNFLRTHCHEGEYAFQVKRCNNLECCPGDKLKENLYWLPSPIPDDENPGHYKKLDYILGNDPTDEWVPSFDKI